MKKKGVNQKEPRFIRTVYYFYGSCIQRVDQKRIEKGFTQKQVYDTDDASLISNFFNMKCTKNNPYLLTDKLLGYINNRTEHAVNESDIKVGILNTLDFNSVHDVLWGTDIELKQNLPLIYRNIMSDLSFYYRDFAPTIENILCDYIPYSECITFSNIKKTQNISIKQYFGIEDESISSLNLQIQRERALLHLYSKTTFRTSFESSFIEFANRTESFTKIDKKLENDYIMPIFIPLLKKHISDDSSLGLRVKKIIENDLILVLNSTLTSEDISDKTFRQALINASSEYIAKLENIQQKIYDAQLGVF